MKIEVEIKNIEHLRNVKWVSYDELEEQKLSRGTFHSIANWTRPVSEKSIKKLTQIFKVPRDEILWLIKKW